MAKNLIVTPKGIAVFPKLNEPDTKFDEAGVYEVKLQLPLDDEKTQDLVTKLKALYDAAPADLVATKPELRGKDPRKLKRAALPYTTDEEAGTVTIKAKMKASWIDKKTQKRKERRPDLYDAMKRKLDPATVRIGGGSVLKVCFEPSAYHTGSLGCGITLRLEAVQVIEVRTFGGGSADSYGFGEEEGDSIEPSAPAKTEATEESTDDETGSDF